MRENKREPAAHVPDTLKQHYAGTSLAKKVDSQQNAADTANKIGNPSQEPTPLEAVIRVWDFIKKPEHANAIMATFTILIFLATGAYTVIATLQWCEMRKTTDTASKSLIADTRAWISPMSAGFEEPPKFGKSLKFGVQYGNVGKSPAFDVRPIYKIRSIPKSSFDDGSIKSTIESDDICKNVPEAPGADVIYPEQPNGYRLDFEFREPNFINDPDIFDGKKAFLMEMCFAYNTTGDLHHTSFCYFYRAGLTKENQWNVCIAGNHAN